MKLRQSVQSSWGAPHNQVLVYSDSIFKYLPTQIEVEFYVKAVPGASVGGKKNLTPSIHQDLKPVYKSNIVILHVGTNDLASCMIIWLKTCYIPVMKKGYHSYIGSRWKGSDCIPRGQHIRSQLPGSQHHRSHLQRSQHARSHLHRNQHLRSHIHQSQYPRSHLQRNHLHRSQHPRNQHCKSHLLGSHPHRNHLHQS